MYFLLRASMSMSKAHRHSNAPTSSVAMVSRLLPTSGLCRLYFLESLCRFSTVADASNSQPHFLLEYLISSLGFSKEEASITTKRLRSTRYFRRNPDLVVNFLSNLGLSKTQIKSMVSVDPKILSYDIDKTLAPKIRVLQDIGLTGPDLVRVLMGYKSILVKPKPPVDYLRNLMGKDELVAEIVKRHCNLLDAKAPKKTASTVELLQKNGLSKANIARLVLNNPACILRSSEFFQGIVDRIENDFGISRQSKMFYHGVAVLSSISDSKLSRQFETFRSLGLSEATINRMLGKFPYILVRAEDKIRKCWDFFVKELGYPPDYLATHPVIVNLNFEKRVKPRTEVLNILKEKKLTRKHALYPALVSSESKFVNNYLLPNEDKIPDVIDSYFKAVGREKEENL